MSQELNQSSLSIQIASSIESKKSPNYKGGKWSKEEHQKFIEGLFIFGNQWKKMQKYIETRTAIQVRSHSQKFMMKLKKKFIELFGKEELISGDFDTQAKHIEYLLTNFFDCEFITNFLQKVAQAKTDDKVIEYIKQKRINFFKIIIALMNNSTIELYSRKIKYLNNSITNSPISTLSSSNDSSQSSPEPNEQFYIDYCAQESKDDLFKISFNDFVQSKNEVVEPEEEFLFFNEI